MAGLALESSKLFILIIITRLPLRVNRFLDSFGSPGILKVDSIRVENRFAYQEGHEGYRREVAGNDR